MGSLILEINPCLEIGARRELVDGMGFECMSSTEDQ